MRNVILSILIFPFTIFSHSQRNVLGEVTENFIVKTGSFDIRLSKNYVQTNEQNFIHLSFRNRGKEVIRFYPNANFFNTFQIFIVDEENTVVPLKEKIEIMPRFIVKDFVGNNLKEVILHPNETFVKTIDLNLYFDFETGKKYFIKSYFFPNYLESKDVFVGSNEVYFYVDEPQRHYNYYGALPIEKETVNPDEVIYLFLNAESRKDWSSYFKWIDFPEYILSYDRFSNTYADSDFSERSLIIEEFKYYLTQLDLGNLQSYEIIDTQIINPKYARVNVDVRRNDGFTTYYEYEYILKKYPTIPFWKITSVIVRVKR